MAVSRNLGPFKTAFDKDHSIVGSIFRHPICGNLHGRAQAVHGIMPADGAGSETLVQCGPCFANSSAEALGKCDGSSMPRVWRMLPRIAVQPSD